MIQTNILKEKLNRSFSLYESFLESIDQQLLPSDLAGLPSNTIGEQIWCVVGARQSYLKAIMGNGWQGFSCSLGKDDIENKTTITEALTSSRIAFMATLESISSPTTTQQSLIMDLIEHEAQHHGQLIRYLYGLKLPIPEQWKKRYNLN